MRRDSRHWLSDVKYSPDGKSFALGSMDHKIYVYNRDTYRLRGTCDRHNSYIKSFDYSMDSMYIQSDAGDYEHLYFEAEDGEYFSAGSQLKDIKWSDWTCTFGWPVNGTWPYFADIEKGIAAEPTCVHRHVTSTGPASAVGTAVGLLAVGDQAGAVTLRTSPCVAKDVRTELHIT